MRRLAETCIRHRRITVLVWVVALLAAGGAAAAVGERFATDFELPDTDSKRAGDLLERGFERSGDSIQVVLRSEPGKLSAEPARGQVTATLTDLAEPERIEGFDPPFGPGGNVAPDATISPDGRTALVELRLQGEAFDVPVETVDELIETAEERSTDELQVELGGAAIQSAGSQPEGTAELIGLGAAIIILLITFGSVVAMGLPIVTAIVALGTALGLVTLQTNVIDTAEFAPALAAMIGLGAGIDYALFIVTRYRAALSQGVEPREAVLVAMDTAGRAVIFAGVTVVVSLLGLFAIGVSFLYGPALAASLAVSMTMFAAITFLPALLSKIGTRIDRFRLPGFKRSGGEGGAGWSRWSRMIQRRPWPAAIVSTAVLIALAIPVVQIDLGVADAGTDSTDRTTRQAYDLLAEAFGPGFNGPLQVVSELDSEGSSERELAALAERLSGVEGVAGIGEPVLGTDGEIALTTVFPTTSPQANETSALVERLRDDVLPDVRAETGIVSSVGGATAVFDDFADFISGKLPLFFGIVILLSALVLLAAFRSVPVAIKAVLMNALSIGASFGLVVAIFQLGFGNELIGIAETAPIEPFLPVMVFAIVFGLSMDYEVFLMSRVHEQWEREGDASAAVQHGLASTGRVITAAATIMVAVFAGFALTGDRTITLFGVALASAIAIDAFVIRSLLVPAIMEILGERAWWLPRWLDRALPELQIEGGSAESAAVEGASGGDGGVDGLALGTTGPKPGSNGAPADQDREREHSPV